MTKSNGSIKEYEVKFFLENTKVLNEKHELKSDLILIKDFQISNFKRRDIQFIDSINKDMYKNGWILRYRKKEEKDKCELTYKKRYAINDDIESMLSQAGKGSLIQSDSKFEVELEWGYAKKVLSVSLEEKEPIFNSSGSNMPSIEELQRLFLHHAPKEFIDWNNKGWGITQINKSRIYGPIYAKVYEGQWDATKINIEIWSKSINGTTESIVEASFKVENADVADQLHLKLKNYLETKNWLIKEDFSKTEWAMK
ncbi:hypothetical protein Q3A90_18060 [Priestia megaterium]|uniref:hypothetical protein n=1 Tax=Priestia megaterium TaxID=1404 RepID=UPI002675CBB5|nr:hypothetical protein [Priestia megaterium]WKU21674.1 hypothetical protein Q3A90_18060 [Priestia megaterium]